MNVSSIVRTICFQVGQALVDTDCKSKCLCQASGMVKCEKLSCASGEVCGLRDGVRGCHVKQAHCSISPRGRLTSFDGVSGAIGAQGAFEAASLCDEAADRWFRVVVDVRVCSEGASPTVAAVYVFFNETGITVNSQHETWVRRAGRDNGNMVNCKKVHRFDAGTLTSMCLCRFVHRSSRHPDKWQESIPSQQSEG